MENEILKRTAAYFAREKFLPISYRLVRELADYSDTQVDVAVACRVLGVSRSGYYDWLDRPPLARQEANTSLLKHIQEVHEDSRGTHGWPRVHAELTLAGTWPSQSQAGRPAPA